MPQVSTTFTEKSEAESAKETISHQHQMSSICSVSTLKDRSYDE